MKRLIGIAALVFLSALDTFGQIVDVCCDVHVCEGISKHALTSTPSGGVYSSIAHPNSINSQGEVLIDSLPAGTHRFYYNLTPLGSGIDSVEVTVAASPIPKLSLTVDSISCNSVTYNFSYRLDNFAGTVIGTIWDFGNGKTSTNITSESTSYPINGDYNVTIHIASANGCKGTTDTTVSVQNCVHVNSRPRNSQWSFSVTTDVVHIELLSNSKKEIITIINSSGKVILQKKFLIKTGINSLSINTSSLSNGIYLISAGLGRKVKRFLINR